MLFIRARMFDKTSGDYYPLPHVVAVHHVVQANDYPITTQREESGAMGPVTYHALTLCRLVSGEAVIVESTPELRQALNLGEWQHASHDFGVIRGLKS